MSATERLRSLLDERGVKWKADTSVINGVVWTIWNSPWFGETWAKEVDGSISLFNCSITPEQAIEATLGSVENAELRKELAVTNQLFETLNDANDRLIYENMKLRELVRDMWENGMCECDERGACAECEYHFPEHMRELGVEI